MQVVEDLLEIAGIGRDRMQLRWVSAAEGQLFAEYVSQITELTRDLGPFDLERHRGALEAIELALGSPRMRWLTGCAKELIEKGNVYNEKIGEEDYRTLLHRAGVEEFEKAIIAQAIKPGPKSVKEISEKTELPIYTVSLRLNELERHGQAELSDYEGSTPKFIGVGA